MPNPPAIRHDQDVAMFEDSDVENLRRQLPLHTYLSLLHQGATTGYVPRLAPNGRMVPRSKQDADGTFVEMDDPVDGKTRVQILQYLVDKAMPSLKSDIPARRLSAVARNFTLADLRSMTNDEILALVQDKRSIAARASASDPVPAAAQRSDGA